MRMADDAKSDDGDPPSPAPARERAITGVKRRRRAEGIAAQAVAAEVSGDRKKAALLYRKAIDVLTPVDGDAAAAEDRADDDTDSDREAG
jgi:hypothetical protein